MIHGPKPESEAHKASRECCNPVPDITTSHFVSLRDSIVGEEVEREIFIVEERVAQNEIDMGPILVLIRVRLRNRITSKSRARKFLDLHPSNHLHNSVLQ